MRRQRGRDKCYEYRLRRVPVWWFFHPSWFMSGEQCKSHRWNERFLEW